MRASAFAGFIIASLALSPTVRAQPRCETIQDKQARIACFERAGVPVIDCDQPRYADDAFCRRYRGVPPSSQPTPTALIPVTVPQPFVVAIETSVSGGTRPTVTGTTNLPNGAHVMILLRRPWLPNGRERLAIGLPACGDSCAALTANCTPDSKNEACVVKNGQFSDGPFTDNGAALSPGTYILEIQMSTTLQPPDVLAIIGSRGENMTGPLVGACCFGYSDQAAIEKMKNTMRDIMRMVGAVVYYGRFVPIGPNPPPWYGVP